MMISGGAQILWTGLLWMTGIALVVARVGYRVGQAKGKVVFAAGVVVAVGLIALTSVACSALPDSAKSEQNSATEASPSPKSDSSRGSTNIREMLKEYEVNPLRAEHLYEGRTMVVGGKITAIEEYMVGGSVVILEGEDPNKGHLPRVQLESGVFLPFASNEARSWLFEKNVGDTIEAQCFVERFESSGSREGLPILSECKQAAE